MVQAESTENAACQVEKVLGSDEEEGSVDHAFTAVAADTAGGWGSGDFSGFHGAEAGEWKEGEAHQTVDGAGSGGLPGAGVSWSNICI